MLTTTLVDEIVDKINGYGVTALYVTAIRGFSKSPGAIPISKITFSVTTEENKTTYFENDEAQLCVRNDIRIRLSVFAPTNRNGEQINSFAELVLDYLADIYIENLKGYEIGDLTYDDDVNAIYLPCYMDFSYTSCALEQDTDGNIPETFFCKSHVNNSLIHLSEEQKEYLDSPCVIGTYTGDGNADGKDINLGFRPKAVIIYRNTYHIASYNKENGTSNCYLGVSIGSTYTRGLMILDKGFRVKTTVTSSATTHLNDSGGVYGYIAFR